MAHDFGLDDVADGELNERGDDDGEDFGGQGKFGAEQDDGQGQEGGDDGADTGDEVQQEGEKAEHVGEGYAEEPKGDADEQAGGAGSEDHGEDIAFDASFDFEAEALRGGGGFLSFAGEQEDQEDQDEGTVGKDAHDAADGAAEDTFGGFTGDIVKGCHDLIGIGAKGIQRDRGKGVMREFLNLPLIYFAVVLDFVDGMHDQEGEKEEDNAAQEGGGDDGQESWDAEEPHLDVDDGNEAKVQEDGEDEGDEDGGELVEGRREGQGG